MTLILIATLHDVDVLCMLSSASSASDSVCLHLEPVEMSLKAQVRPYNHISTGCLFVPLIVNSETGELIVVTGR